MNAAKIDLRDATLDTLHQLIGGRDVAGDPYTGQYAICFDHVSLILTEQQMRDIRDLSAEIPDPWEEPDDD